MKHKEIYISVDVETDGPIPGPNSILSLGAAAFTEDGNMLSTFSINLHTLEGATADPDTARWWLSQPEAWAEVQKDRQGPAMGMHAFHGWVKEQESKGFKPVFVGYPAGFDFLFVYWYLIRFVGHSPFSFSAIDMKTFAMAVLGLPYHECTKRSFPKMWFSGDKHSHVAVEDAIEQGRIFCKMLKHPRVQSWLTISTWILWDKKGQTVWLVEHMEDRYGPALQSMGYHWECKFVAFSPNDNHARDFENWKQRNGWID